MVARTTPETQGQTPRYHDPRGAISLRRAAKLLGCNRSHLSRVLRGQRPSKALTARYSALVLEVQKTVQTEGQHTQREEAV